MTRVEMLLYAGLEATGQIEVSTTSAAGPWTPLALTSTKGVLAALAEWESMANSALPARTWFFFYVQNEGVTLEATGGSAWVRLTPCLATLLGFSATVLAVGVPPGETSDQVMLGVLDDDVDKFAVGVSWPMAVESAELSEYRGGRASAYHFGRALELDVDLYVPASLWDDVALSPLVTGHAAMRIERDDAAAWHPSTAPKGVLVVYPLETVSVERPVAEEHVWIRLRCTMEDL